jgi:hypothetical protein
MARAETQTGLAEATEELQCIAEVMLTLAEITAQSEGTVPARWMTWLGDCVGNATSRLADCLGDPEIPSRRDRRLRPIRPVDIA